MNNPIYKIRRKRIIWSVLGVLLVWYAFCLPRELFDVSYSTVVTDRNGELLGARIAEDGQWRFPVRDTVPEKLKQCIIAFEDKSFYWHWGVDLLAIGRAMMMNPKLLLLDEPSLGLAPLIIKDIFQAIQQIAAEGVTVLMVEQNARQAMMIADYV